MWLRTVGSAIPSRSAIAFAEYPWSISSSTSSWRGVRAADRPEGWSSRVDLRFAVSEQVEEERLIAVSHRDRRDRHAAAGSRRGLDQQLLAMDGPAFGRQPCARAAGVADERAALVETADDVPAALAHRVGGGDPGERLGGGIPAHDPPLLVEDEQRVPGSEFRLHVVDIRHSRRRSRRRLYRWALRGNPDATAPDEARTDPFWPWQFLRGARARDRAWPGHAAIYSIGIWRRMSGSIRSRIAIRLGPVTVMPWLRRPITASPGFGSAARSSATLTASSSVPHG